METAFKHSAKVPRRYKTTAKFIQNQTEKGVSLKTQIFTAKHERTHALTALIAKIVEHKPVLDIIIEKSEILQHEARLDPYLCLVLTAELLFSKNGLTDPSKPVQCVLSYRDKFLELLEEHKDVLKDCQLQKEANQVNVKPRYVRINTNLMSRADAIEAFGKDGWEEVADELKTYDDFLAAVGKLGEAQYLSDIHVQNLFVFPSSSRRYWAEHQLVKEFKVLLQDKSSCLSSYFLDPPKGSIVLDMCAAPGNKTSHLASIMKNRGTIFAVEYNELRFQTLNERMAQTKSNIVKTIKRDVLTVDAELLKSKVEYILLDPPCSGSGMQGRLSLHNKSAERKRPEGDRLFQLGGLQIKMLAHAMKHFPNAKRIVYSTCSTSADENEHVVQRAFEFVPDQNWELIKPLEFAEKWKNFGSAKYKHIGKKCIYAIAEIDRTDGFFVAILERTFGDKPQPFAVEKLAPHVLNNLSLSNNGTSNHHEEEQVAEDDDEEEERVQEVPVDVPSSSKKKRQKNTSVSEATNRSEVPDADTTIEESPGDAENKKKKKKRKSKGGDVSQDVIDISLTEDKPKKNKISKTECIEILTDTEEPSPHDNETVADSAKKGKKKRKIEETVAVSTPTDKKKKKK